MSVALGLDIGSTTTKIVALDASGTLLWHRIEPTEPRMDAQAERLRALALAETGESEARLAATGYGRNLVKRADRRVTEITCHARGVFSATGHGGTLIDVGGQDTKVIEIRPDGGVGDFAMNDRCAAGTGRFLEVTASRLRMDLDAFGAMGSSAGPEEALSSTCAVFAESEVISLLAQGRELEAIVRGLHRALVKRVAALARGRAVRPPVMLSGGVARNPAVHRMLQEELGLAVEIPTDAQLMGALGAALGLARG